MEIARRRIRRRGGVCEIIGNTYKSLVGKHEGKRLIKRLRKYDRNLWVRFFLFYYKEE